MSPGPDRISLDEAKEALLRSGYPLEHRLETILRSEGYYVEGNSAYPDPDTGKSREFDLYGMLAVRAGPEEYDFIFPVLLIECINNPQPIAFLTKEPLVGFLHYQEIKLAGLPVKVPEKGTRSSWVSLPEYLAMEKYHHYCKGRIATQFCSFVEKKRENRREWMATHDQVHFDAFHKLSAAVEYFLGRHFESWKFGGRENVNVEFFYPALVVQGELLEVQPRNRALKIRKVDHLQYRRSAIVGNEETTYQIDVVTGRFFQRYLELVGQEMSKTATLLRRRHVVVRAAIERIVRTARRFRSPAKIRSALAF